MGLFASKQQKAEASMQEGAEAMRAGRFSQAEMSFRAAIRWLKGRGEADQLAQAYHALGDALWRQQRLDDALPPYRSAAELATVPQFRAIVLSRLGTCLSRLGQRREALLIWQQELNEARESSSPVGLVHALSMVAQGHRDTGGDEEIQRSSYDEMVAIAQNLPVWEPEWIYPILMDLAARGMDQRDTVTLEMLASRLRRRSSFLPTLPLPLEFVPPTPMLPMQELRSALAGLEQQLDAALAALSDEPKRKGRPSRIAETLLREQGAGLNGTQ